MKPSRTQYFFAQNWPFRLWLAGGTVAAAVIAGIAAGITPENLGQGISLGKLGGLLAVAGLLGFLVAGLLDTLVLGPIYHARGRLNGAPFRTGDRVRILVGPHRDRVVRVYEVWETRQQVRVEIGERAKWSTKDVFSFSQVCREADAAPREVFS